MVTLNDILRARDARAAAQRRLLDRHGLPLISFTLNIPGPRKQSGLYARIHERGLDALLKDLEADAFPTEQPEGGTFFQVLGPDHRKTGSEAFVICRGEALRIKRIAANLEETHPLGRLFDMDVLCPAHGPLSRSGLGLPPRRCLLCNEEAAVCVRSRRHPTEALLERIEKMAGNFFRAEEATVRGPSPGDLAQSIAALAHQALLAEARATPKPGLVDRRNNGAHRDMDLSLLEKSADCLRPYFLDCAQTALDCRDPGALFPRLRRLGLEAERTMFRTTNGVNTHKGAVFSLGVLCAASALAARQGQGLGGVEHFARLLCADLVQKELEETSSPLRAASTAGEHCFRAYGITGARGQAQAGFPQVLREALPALERGLARGLSLNDACAQALPHLIATVDDTNILSRAGPEGLRFARAYARSLLEKSEGPDPEALQAMDQAFIDRNISPGGCADLLGAACFLHFLIREGILTQDG